MSNLGQIIGRFVNPEDVIETKTYGKGHINDTYLVTCLNQNSRTNYILRKINRFVFKRPELIVENGVRITEHIEKKILQQNIIDHDKRILKIRKTFEGNNYYKDDSEDIWSMMNFIENSYSIETVETTGEAYEAAKAYGRFLKYLIDFNPGECVETIKDFHNLQKRINYFNEAVEKNPLGRVEKIKEIVKAVKKYEFIEKKYQQVIDEKLPLRITHNDTKINNVLLDEKTNGGLCVIDLDTVMPGIIINDFGDMVRTFTPSLNENRKEVSDLNLRLPVFESLAKGYLSETAELLTEREVRNLVNGALIITFEQAVRFATDYILGDVYYKTDYENHNLIRTENQLQLLSEIISKKDLMDELVSKNYEYFR